MTTYHDREWGTPQHDDRVLFEFLILEGAQAGLSWDTILRKREHYRRAIWGFVGGTSVLNRPRRLSDIPAQTPVSVTMSKDLRLHGFRFVGPTICYAFMQAVGLVNDHTVDCFRARRAAPR